MVVAEALLWRLAGVCLEPQQSLQTCPPLHTRPPGRPSSARHRAPSFGKRTASLPAKVLPLVFLGGGRGVFFFFLQKRNVATAWSRWCKKGASWRYLGPLPHITQGVCAFPGSSQNNQLDGWYTSILTSFLFFVCTLGGSQGERHP